ncbi:uncharacterized protein G2W53_001658 [Senna tora]|uniref:Uncharacterized protein n=1 Tax=Senna tora TaxID=362788 RepID=A0A834XK50_9FABA|nr:uncharacterized protein G2W53_001658 [Senna tora]
MLLVFGCVTGITSNVSGLIGLGGGAGGKNSGCGLICSGNDCFVLEEAEWSSVEVNADLFVSGADLGLQLELMPDEDTGDCAGSGWQALILPSECWSSRIGWVISFMGFSWILDIGLGRVGFDFCCRRDFPVFSVLGLAVEGSRKVAGEKWGNHCLTSIGDLPRNQGVEKSALKIGKIHLRSCGADNDSIFPGSIDRVPDRGKKGDLWWVGRGFVVMDEVEEGKEGALGEEKGIRRKSDEGGIPVFPSTNF